MMHIKSCFGRSLEARCWDIRADSTRREETQAWMSRTKELGHALHVQPAWMCFTNVRSRT
jgi:hypothetical protein